MSFAVAVSAYARQPFKVQWNDSTSVSIAFTLTEDGVGSDYAVRAVPVLVGDNGDTLRLDPTLFRGKRNMRYAMRQRYYGLADRVAAAELPLGQAREYGVELSRKDHPWLWTDEVSLDIERTKEGCCDVIPMQPEPLGTMVYVPTFVPRLADVPDNTGRAGMLERDNPVLLHISKYRPYDKTRILRKEKGALYVHFPVGKAVINHDFRDNAPTLDRIVSITRDIMADTTSTVKCIQIIGLASVEGAVLPNSRLAGSRATALKRYIQQRVPTADALYECVNGGEAWTELRDQIADTDCQWRDALLAIIDNEADLDSRERQIRSLNGGRAYAFLKENILSDQRNSGYLRIYYDYVPDTAAHTINRATDLMRRGQYADALPMLRSVEADPRSWNALGVALYMTGAKAEAITCFRRAQT